MAGDQDERFSFRPPGPYGPAGEIVPERQRVQAVGSQEVALEALQGMVDEGYSYLPVKDDGEVRGSVSAMGVLRRLLDDPLVRERLQALAVGSFAERAVFVGVDEWVDTQLDWCEDQAALVGTPRDLRGIITYSDLLRRLHDFSEAFLVISEIESQFRALYGALFPFECWREPIHATLRQRSSSPEGGRLPEKLEDLTFWHYATLVDADEFAARLRPHAMKSTAWLSQQTHTARLIRNDVMHFRRRIDRSAIEKLQQLRNELGHILQSARPARTTS